MTVTYRCPSCQREHKLSFATRADVVRSRFCLCAQCSAAAQQKPAK